VTTREEKGGEGGGGGSGETQETPSESLAREIGNTGGARARILNESTKLFYHSNLSCCGAVQGALSLGGSGREVFGLATCPLQFAKAGSATVLPQL
jgi:hypothetical protein